MRLEQCALCRDIQGGILAIKYVNKIDVVAGRCDQLSPLIRRVVAANSGPFTFTGTGTYIVGNGEVCVIDPGPLDEFHVDAIFAALGPDEVVSHILLTHTHSDHSPATRILQQRCAAKCYGFGPHMQEELDQSEQWIFDDDEANVLGGVLKEGADMSFSPDVVLRDGDKVNGGDWELEAVYTPGHTSNHLCFFLGSEGVLFTGDHVMGWSTSVIDPPDGNMTDYMASLRKLLDRDERCYWPTHGPAIMNPHEFVESFIAHREARFAAILAELKLSPATIVELVPKMYAEVSKKLWQPAAASTFAALLHLVELGEVVVDGDRPKRTSLFT